MRRHGICARRKRRYIRTTDSNHPFPIPGNVLERRFQVDRPNTVWAGDITYIPTRQGWLFLAVVLDLCSRAVVGWSMSERIDAALTRDALTMAVNRRHPDPGLLVHSDRGIQYAATEYRAELQQLNFRQSMSRRGDCYDNAPVESFFSSLKNELVHHSDFQTRGQASAAVFDYIEVFYNRQRRHSALKYLSPTQYEATLTAANAA
jgi:transposase InsO family protein